MNVKECLSLHISIDECDEMDFIKHWKRRRFDAKDSSPQGKEIQKKSDRDIQPIHSLSVLTCSVSTKNH
jgi:hypothetical protein